MLMLGTELQEVFPDFSSNTDPTITKFSECTLIQNGDKPHFDLKKMFIRTKVSLFGHICLFACYTHLGDFLSLLLAVHMSGSLQYLHATNKDTFDNKLLLKNSNGFEIIIDHYDCETIRVQFVAIE